MPEAGNVLASVGFLRQAKFLHAAALPMQHDGNVRDVRAVDSRCGDAKASLKQMWGYSSNSGCLIAAVPTPSTSFFPKRGSIFDGQSINLC
jgi:hypothetical protein